MKKQLGSFSLAASLSIERPGITVLFGKSGAGKSSLVQAVAGLLRPDEGHITLGERHFFDSRRGINVPPHKRGVGYVFQSGRLFPHMTVKNNLLYGHRYRGTKQLSASGGGASAEFSLESVSDVLALDALMDRRPGTLSGGEKQRVAIGRALLSCPDLLLMDEPLSSLDGNRKSEILPAIERLRDQFKIPILYVSHSIEEVTRLADTLAIIDNGRIAASGSPMDLMVRLDLRPLTGRYEAGAVLEGSIAAINDQYDLMTIEITPHSDGQSEMPSQPSSLVVPGMGSGIGSGIGSGSGVVKGQRVRLRIRARDVALARARPTDTSMLNALEGTISELTDEAGAFCEVKIRTNDGAYLLARVTRFSADTLQLRVGMPIFALIKAVALDRITPQS
ncbi:MAG: molybdenum ABC transporter ATP-binding protein [Pseudomonadota bacterium]